MDGEWFGYQLSTGEYVIEGSRFVLQMSQGHCTIVPQRLLGPPVLPLAGNAIGLHVSFSGVGPRGERISAETLLLEGRASVFTTLRNDLVELIGGNCEAVEFPAEEYSEFSTLISCFKLIVTQDNSSSTGWLARCSISTPTWWNGYVPPPTDDRENVQFACTASVQMEVTSSSLEQFGYDIGEFVNWLLREARS